MNYTIDLYNSTVFIRTDNSLTDKEHKKPVDINFGAKSLTILL